MDNEPINNQPTDINTPTPVVPITPVQSQPIDQPVAQAVIEPNPVITPNIVPTSGTVPQITVVKPKKGINKKLLIIIIAIIAIVGLGILALFLFWPKSGGNGGSLVSADMNELTMYQTKPILIKSGEKYGFISSEGKVIVKPKYDFADKFYGSYAPVGMKINNGNILYQIIDKSGKSIIDNIEYIPGYYPKYGVWSINGSIYNNQLKKISNKDYIVGYSNNGYFSFTNVEDDIMGIMDSTGKITFSVKIDYEKSGGASRSLEVSGQSYEKDLGEVYGIINYRNKDAIINCKTGKIVAEFDSGTLLISQDNVFQNTKHTNSYKEYGYIFVHNDKIAYQTDQVGKKISWVDVKPGNPNIILEISGGDIDNVAYYDVTNEKFIDELPVGYTSSITYTNEDLISNSTGIKKITCGDDEGFERGEDTITKCGDYYGINYLALDTYMYVKEKTGIEYVTAWESNDSYLIDVKDGSIAKTFNNRTLFSESGSTFLFTYDNDLSVPADVYNLLTKKSMKLTGENEVSFYSNYFTVTKDEKVKYYNTDLKMIYETDKETYVD